MFAIVLGLAAALSTGDVRTLVRPEGVIAYEVIGDKGPWILAAPGIGDVRAQYRYLAPQLVAHGYRVALMDLRGLGGSTDTFSAYSADAVGDDMVALLHALGAEHATIIGNSASAASAVWAAATLPDVVANIVLIGPFVREMPAPWYQRALLGVAFKGFWGRPTWMAYYASLYPTAKPPDFREYRAQLSASLDGRMNVVNAMLGASKAACEAKLPAVSARTLVVMGSRDPDFPHPSDEAERVAAMLHGDVLIVDGAGHYPHAEVPDVTGAGIVDFLQPGVVANGR
jgi:pimeloyl-ACP methyl ester carboxylesterase